MKKNRIGICKLTLTNGKFVDSHIIPKALTKPAQKGMPFLQFKSDRHPIKRWSSWYDPCLVTQAGEDILTEFDTWAIIELRKHKLVWSSWGENRTLGTLHDPTTDTPSVIRKIEGIDKKNYDFSF